MKYQTRKPSRNNTLIYRLLLPVFALLAVFPAVAQAETEAMELQATPHYRLDIAVDVEKAIIRGIAEIVAPPGVELAIYPNGTKILELLNGGEKIDLYKVGEDDQIFVEAAGTIRMVYEVSLGNGEDQVISAEEIVFMHNWYPQIDGLCTYQLQADLPAGFIAISEGEPVSAHRRGDRDIFTFAFFYPYSDELTLTASKRFVVSLDASGPVPIYTYFYREDAHRAPLFLEWAKRYLKQYATMIGPYPYKRFSIVESSRSTACSLPTYIQMTRRYVRSGNVEDTALGHEIVHQWFGNYVFADFEEGNWIEGLTIYFADHFATEQKDKAVDCRKRMLIGFENYVKENKAFPLSRFWERTDDASRSIGYGKSAFVFHMLRRRGGDEAFFGVIKTFVQEYAFKVATWKDIQNAFERNTGADLTAFFQQWVHEVGLPILELADVRYAENGSTGEIAFTVNQIGTVYDLQVPVSIYTKTGKQTAWLTVNRETNAFTLPVAGEPVEIVLDEGFDVFRRLSVAETPPLVERLLTDEKIIIIQPPFSKDLYASVLADFEKKDGVRKIAPRPSQRTRRLENGQAREKVNQEHTTPYWDAKANQLSFPMERPWRQRTRPSPPDGGQRFLRQGILRETAQLTDQDIASSSLLILGAENPLLRRLGIRVEKSDAGFGISVRKNPLNPQKVLAIALGKTKEEIDLGWRRVADYPKYSGLFFDQGALVGKERRAAANGIRETIK